LSNVSQPFANRVFGRPDMLQDISMITFFDEAEQDYRFFGTADHFRSH